MTEFPGWLAAALTVAGYLLTLLLLRWVLLTKKEQPSSTVAWVMTIVLVPYVGGLLFLVFGINRVDRRARLKVAADRAIERQLPSVTPYQVLPDELDDPLSRTLMRLAARVGRTAPVGGNEVRLLTDTRQAFALIEEAIASAEESLHLEYYIWQRDRTGTRLRDLIVSKAREGVRVRFLFDGVGSLFLNNRFLKPMRDAGIRVAAFLPGATVRERWSLNLRNHRKIVVADGRVGFTGGMNIGDEYLGLSRDRGYWRDAHLRVEGPAVLQLQQVFAEDWFFATSEPLTDLALYPDPGEPGNVVAQVVTGGPTGPSNPTRLVLFEAIGQARHSIHLTTGYFVPPLELARALEAAALRGVRVRLMVPGRSSYLWTIYAGRSYYDSLLAAEAEIYEYRRGAMHAKTLTVDGRWSLVGSANLDSRSLMLNFEAGLAIDDPRTADQLERQFDDDVKDCLAIDPDLWTTRPSWRGMAENTFRMFAPLF
jgi:cardiolipin synthase